MKFKGKGISKIKRWFLKLLLRIGLMKESNVKVTVSDFHKKLMQFNKKQLIQKAMYLAAQLINGKESLPNSVYQNYLKLSKRELIRVVLSLTVMYQNK